MLAELVVKDPDRPVKVPVKSGRLVREGLVRMSRSQHFVKSTSLELLKSSGVFHRPSDTCLCADKHLVVFKICSGFIVFICASFHSILSELHVRVTFL